MNNKEIIKKQVDKRVEISNSLLELNVAVEEHIQKIIKSFEDKKFFKDIVIKVNNFIINLSKEFEKFNEVIPKELTDKLVKEKLMVKIDEQLIKKIIYSMLEELFNQDLQSKMFAKIEKDNK